MKIFSLLTALLLAGCRQGSTFSDVKRKSIRIHISENPAIKTAGIAYMTDTECAIALKQYPVCLLHEIRHCLEGQWPVCCNGAIMSNNLQGVNHGNNS